VGRLTTVALAGGESSTTGVTIDISIAKTSFRTALSLARNETGTDGLNGSGTRHETLVIWMVPTWGTDWSVTWSTTLWGDIGSRCCLSQPKGVRDESVADAKKNHTDNRFYQGL
jgi:hypothetical protein